MSLSEQFIRRYSKEFGRNVEKMDPECLPLLMNHNWPGNVRELENTIMRCVVNADADADTIRRDDIQLLDNPKPSKMQYNDILPENSSYKAIFSNWEANMLRQIYTQEGRNKTRMAKRLGLSVRSIYQKLKLYGIGED